MPKDTIKMLTEEFQKEPNDRKTVITCAIIVLISTIFPWAYKLSGLYSWGILSLLSSAGIIAHWVMLKMNIKLPESLPKEDVLKKILTAVMIAGPIFWLIDSGFEFKFIGIGLWIALIVSGVAVSVEYKDIINKIKAQFTSKKSDTKKEETDKKD